MVLGPFACVHVNVTVDIVRICPWTRTDHPGPVFWIRKKCLDDRLMSRSWPKRSVYKHTLHLLSFCLSVHFKGVHDSCVLYCWRFASAIGLGPVVVILESAKCSHDKPKGILYSYPVCPRDWSGRLKSMNQEYRRYTEKNKSLGSSNAMQCWRVYPTILALSNNLLLFYLFFLPCFAIPLIFFICYSCFYDDPSVSALKTLQIRTFHFHEKQIHTILISHTSIDVHHMQYFLRIEFNFFILRLFKYRFTALPVPDFMADPWV